MRQANDREEGIPHPRDEGCDDVREALVRRLARAPAVGRSAIDSAPLEAGDGQITSRVRESSKLDFPKQLPTVTNLDDWKGRVALDLAQASGIWGPEGGPVVPGMRWRD